LLHDECIIDLADEEKSDLLDIVKIFSETEFGKFKTKVKIGTDFSSVKEIKLKVK
jgi:hypothetical protein